MEDIDALALLKEEMETEEVHLKVNAIHRLMTVILCIGVEDTIKKLIPYLESNFNKLRSNNGLGLVDKEDDEDELESSLANLAKIRRTSNWVVKRGNSLQVWVVYLVVAMCNLC
jgi:hypothetical protein